MKNKSKIALLILAVMLLVSVFAFTGCKNGNNQSIEPPDTVYKVHRIRLQFENKTIEGTLTADVSAETLQLTASVQKDAGADATVTFSSNNPSVATIDQTGKVTLVGKGETVITAKAGDQDHAIVLIVKDDFATGEVYTVTVNGGTASVTKAAPGEYVTLTAIIPEHKDFERWNFSVRGLLINGNVFRMPAEDVVIDADYTDKLYQLNVVGAAKVFADGEEIKGEVIGNNKNSGRKEHTIVSYGVIYGAELKVQAYGDSKDMMFVGWDEGEINNRVGKMGDFEHTFVMPGEAYTVWANYSTLTSKVLTASPSNYYDTSKGSKVISNGIPQGETADPDLGGLSGYRLTFTPGQSAASGYSENIPGSVLDTIDEGTNTMKAIFKNHGDYDVTLELYVTYYGNIATSGHVTVPAKSTVTKYFTGGLGIYKPYFGVALREDIEGSGSNFNVDMVLGCAPMYPEGDPLLRVTGKAELVQLDTSTDTQFGWGKDFKYNAKYGLTTYCIYGAQFSGNTPAARSVMITNMPEYDPENPYTTIYARVINNASGDYLSKFDVCVSQVKDVRGIVVPCETVVHEKAGDVVVIKITIPRTANDGPFYLSVRKTTVENTGGYYPHNFSMVLAYNNVFGYEEEGE